MTDSTTIALWEQHNEAGRLAFSQGDHASAEESFRAAIADAEGEDSQQLASSLSNLGQLKYQLRDYPVAEELFRRSLDIRERLLGVEHHGLVQTINNLAAVHIARADLEHAEPLFRRALSITERQLGMEHPEVAIFLNNLARLYFKRNAYSQAEPLLLRLLAIKQTQGHDHPEVATVLASLATVRQALGKYDVAEQLWRRVLAIRQKSLPANDPAVATSLENLADVCASRAKLAEAVMLRQKALSIREQPLGAGHASLAGARTKIDALRKQIADTEAAAAAAVAAAAVRPIEPEPVAPSSGHQTPLPADFVVPSTTGMHPAFQPRTEPRSAPRARREPRSKPRGPVIERIEPRSPERPSAPALGSYAPDAMRPATPSDMWAPSPISQRARAVPMSTEEIETLRERERRPAFRLGGIGQGSRRGLLPVVGGLIAAAVVAIVVFTSGGESRPTNAPDAAESVAPPARSDSRTPALAAPVITRASRLPSADSIRAAAAAESAALDSVASRIPAISAPNVNLDDVTGAIDRRTRARVDSATRMVDMKAPTFETRRPIPRD